MSDTENNQETTESSESTESTESTESPPTPQAPQAITATNLTPLSSAVAPLKLNPDLELIKTLNEWGGGDLKTCFQCATCSVVCPLSPDINPFPRKEMLWAQWGMREKLENDPDLWLCHRCNDCSELCPRGAKTGDVMAALRTYSIQQHAWPRFLGRWINRPTLLPILLAFPVLVIWGIIQLGGNLSRSGANLPELSSGFWGQMIEPWPWLDLTFILAATFAVLSFSMSISGLWKGFMKSGVQPNIRARVPLWPALSETIMDILFHRKFDKCGAAHARRWGHIMILFGFGGLFLTTTLVFVGMYVFGLKTPLPLTHWIKIIGNASTITITIGLIMVIFRRLNPAEVITNGRNSYQDVLFLGVITLTVITGTLSQIFRLATMNTAAYSTYFLHLVFIFFLIFYAPFSKFAQVLYHATTLVWAKHVGRELKTLPVKDDLPAHPAPKPTTAESD